MVTTRWKDNSIHSIEDFAGKIEGITERQTMGAMYSNITASMKFDENKAMSFGNLAVQFNLVEYKYTKVMSQSGSEDEITQTLDESGRFVVYQIDTAVYYVIEKNTGSKRDLRLILGYEGKGEIEAAQLTIPNDMYLWMVYKVFMNNGELTNSFSLDRITGIKGKTEDSMSTVSIHGDTIPNMLSALAFLLENEEFKNITIWTRFLEHDDIGFSFTRGTQYTYVDIDSSSYIGPFRLLGESTDESLFISKLYLLVYLEILPQLVSLYREEKVSDDWGNAQLADFFTDLGRRVNSKVNDRIQSKIGERQEAHL
ncbi:hypothetical protein [Weissella confusa]|uniref:hypothetical protein n=1 Tax=Weissella confusa TaxID=1583 RepID=UPI0022FE46BE|nr:hypothetical protein [Weissella confusa]MDA5456799.1 hypothetical protein [Weissella confusa]